MKYLVTAFSVVFFCLPLWLHSQVEVLYRLEYDFGTQTYIFSMNSNTGYLPPQSLIANSTQMTVVVPQIPGGWQVTNLMGLVVSAPNMLTYSVSYLDGTTYGLTDDYLFFSPNAVGYTPFPIPANTWLPLFSFQTSSGCVGDLSLYDNDNDPLTAIQQINAGHNIVILGAGPGNKYAGNASGDVPCVAPCAADAGTLSY
jgi:hypothetical protein